MNNRPLFWAVMCFALGEVTYIWTDKGSKIGTAFVVLIFGAFVIGRTKLSIRRKLLYPMMFALGVLRIFWADYTFAGEELFGRGNYEECSDIYDGYKVSYVTGELDSIEGGYLKSQINLYGVGLVDNVTDGTNGYNVTLRIAYSETEDAIISHEYKIIVYGVKDCIKIGHKVKVNGIVRDFVPSYNPGEFNRKNYYRARGIVGYGIGDDVELVELAEGEETALRLKVGVTDEIYYRLKAVLTIVKKRLENTLSDITSQDSRALFSGILFGDRSDIPQQDMLLYRISGIAHIFAISGVCTLSLVSLRPP